MPYKVPWRPTEPAREAIYRKLYVRIGVQDDCISWLLTEVRALQKRVDKLEQRNVHTAANMVRAAYERAEEIWDDLKQHDDSSTTMQEISDEIEASEREFRPMHPQGKS